MVWSFLLRVMYVHTGVRQNMLDYEVEKKMQHQKGTGILWLVIDSLAGSVVSCSGLRCTPRVT